MNYLSPLDAVFLRMETKRTPMHVGAMMTFKLPDDAPPDFVRKLMEQMRTHPFMPSPFDCRLARGRLSRLAPAWEKCNVDMEYHMRHSALPYPGGERELGVLVARMHSHPLDLSRPLWECHLIEGLENRRFALYFKAHHCAIDGMGAMRMVQKWLSTDPNDTRGMGPWMLAEKPEREAAAPESLWTRLQRPARAAAEQARGVKELVKGLTKMTKGEDSGTRAALTTPRSLFNVPVSQQRRLGTQILDLNRIKAVAKATDASVNDVLLGICGGAIRRYLVEQNALPEKSLLASVPVALQRSAGEGGNAVAGFVVPIGTQLEDPAERVRLASRVTTRSKQELMEMPRAALDQLALIGLAPFLVGQMTGTLPKIPPMFNFVISNVVLSKDSLYLMGAELEAMYPVSFLFDGYALNITLVGYKDRVAVGFLGCREAIPRLQRLAVYTQDALAELEQSLGIGTAPSAAPTPKSAKKKAPARRKRA
ncbi:MAG: wax ester/triacylglycerol synthase family O-acyltransferase [Nevskiaceae bacterium]|nr:MAG: wax ester/triacylglycerol synthase family O-acyltransferase [Nevskiaceae bacterium]